MGLTLATVPLAVTNLSRMQFAVTAITHFLFVTTTVGMLLTTMIFEFLYAYGRGDELVGIHTVDVRCRWGIVGD